MKKVVLIVLMGLFSVTDLSAMTIDTMAKLDTVYGQPTQVQRSFGKLSSSGEYGIFLHVTCRPKDGESNDSTLFYRLISEVGTQDKQLYTIIDGKKITLAEKKWYGWKIVDGVKIQHSMKRTPYPTFKVWLEVE